MESLGLGVRRNLNLPIIYMDFRRLIKTIYSTKTYSMQFLFA